MKNFNITIENNNYVITETEGVKGIYDLKINNIWDYSVYVPGYKPVLATIVQALTSGAAENFIFSEDESYAEDMLKTLKTLREIKQSKYYKDHDLSSLEC